MVKQLMAILMYMMYSCLAVLILILIFCVLKKTQTDPLLVDPDDGARENIVYYDEEGAGEPRFHLQNI